MVAIVRARRRSYCRESLLQPVKDSLSFLRPATMSSALSGSHVSDFEVSVWCEQFTLLNILPKPAEKKSKATAYSINHNISPCKYKVCFTNSISLHTEYDQPWFKNNPGVELDIGRLRHVPSILHLRQY